MSTSGGSWKGARGGAGNCGELLKTNIIIIKHQYHLSQADAMIAGWNGPLGLQQYKLVKAVLFINVFTAS